MIHKSILILVPCLLLLSTTMIYRSFRIVQSIPVTSEHPVRVDFFVMSKCPDARKCEMTFLPALMKLLPIVNFTVSFIAYQRQPNEIHCMHGADECLGNRQQLCIQDLHSQRGLMDFLYCQSNHYQFIPYNGESCHKNLADRKIPWSHIQRCLDSNRSIELFHQALERTRFASAEKSCTIHLNGKFWCMHDGTWLQCLEGHDERSLIRAICSRYDRREKLIECAQLI